MMCVIVINVDVDVIAVAQGIRASFDIFHDHYLHYPITQPGNLIPYLMPMTVQSLFSDFTMGAIASQITSLTIVYLTVYSDADQRKHQSSASLAFVRGIHRWPVNSPNKWPVTRKMFPYDDVIMHQACGVWQSTQSELPIPSGARCRHYLLAPIKNIPDYICKSFQ